MYCTHRRPLGEAVRAIIHTVRFVTVMVMTAGAFGTFGMFGSIVHASERANERANERASEETTERASGEMTGGCSAIDGIRRQLRVRLVPAKGVAAAMREVVEEEVVELWRPYGVDVVWEDVWEEGDTGPKPELFVFFVDRELKGRVTRGATAVAWIRFVQGVPSPLINVSVAAAQRLLNESDWIDERPVRAAPNSVQHRLVGRMIGRALAHEIGHYLLASSRHAEKGLMKPLITPAEFVKVGRNHLQLVPDDVRTLRTARLASCQLTASAGQ